MTSIDQYENIDFKRFGKYDDRNTGRKSIVVQTQTTIDVIIALKNKSRTWTGVRITKDKTVFIRKLKKNAFYEKLAKKKQERNTYIAYVVKDDNNKQAEGIYG